jgi:hypothetical protein
LRQFRCRRLGRFRRTRRTSPDFRPSHGNAAADARRTRSSGEVSPWDKKTPSPSTGRPSEATREAVSLGRLLAQPRVDLRSFADQVVVATADQSIVSRIRSAQLTCPNIATTATPSRIVTGPLGNARNFPPSDVRKALNRSKSSRSSRHFGDDLADDIARGVAEQGSGFGRGVVAIMACGAGPTSPGDPAPQPICQWRRPRSAKSACGACVDRVGRW